MARMCTRVCEGPANSSGQNGHLPFFTTLDFGAIYIIDIYTLREPENIKNRPFCSNLNSYNA